MEEDIVTSYQTEAKNVLARNKNIADILSKMQCANAKTTRSVVKAVTSCGCVSVGNQNDNGIDGELCEECKAEIETQMGETLFYLASLCNALDISMKDVLIKDKSRTDMIGKYSLR